MGNEVTHIAHGIHCRFLYTSRLYLVHIRGYKEIHLYRISLSVVVPVHVHLGKAPLLGILGIVPVFLGGFKVRNSDYLVVSSRAIGFLVDILLPGRPMGEPDDKFITGHPVKVEIIVVRVYRYLKSTQTYST